MKKDFIFISESVTEGHPDKLCDQISDAMVDRFLREDPFALVSVECAISQAIVFIAAQFSSPAVIDIPHIAREMITQVGYNSPALNGRNCTVLTSIKDLPMDRGTRLDESALDEEAIDRIVATHQTNAFGYACTQTSVLMPLPIWLAHKLARRLTNVRYTSVFPTLAPDAKAQVGVEYRDGLPARIYSIGLQICIESERGDASLPKDLEDGIITEVIGNAFHGERIAPDNATRVHIEINDPLVTCGPHAHSGLTGRKTAIDTYGEYARHGGAALSGKSPDRIDRIGNYAARYAAKNIVAAGLAEECEVQLSYSLGQASPVSILIETFGTGKLPDPRIQELVRELFDFRPAGIIQRFKLRHLPRLVKGGFYRKLAAYGHVGRMDIGLPWEVTDKVEDLRRFLSH